MSFKEWCGYMKDEWAFYKRHPEMFLPWTALAYAFYIILKKAKP